MDKIDFLWWNLESFSHFDPGRVAEDQWPISPTAYLVKQGRIEKVLQQIYGATLPQLFAFAEITYQAAVEFRDRLIPHYEVHSLDDGLPRSQLQVAFLYDPKLFTFPSL